MPTKILVIETPNFQLGANAGEQAERLDPAAFPARVQQHQESGTKDLLFVIAPDDLRFQPAFANASQGPGSVSVAFFPKTEDAVRFLPSIFLFASDTRALGAKECLAKGSTVYSETLFNGKAVGSKLDPVFAFARRKLSSLAATNAWGSIQALVFHGLQLLPEQGEKGTGEKVDVQLGADEKVLVLTVRFDLPAANAAGARMNPILALPRAAAGVFESRYIADAQKMEFNCVFFLQNGPARPIEISSFQKEAGLENPEAVKDMQFKGFGAIDTSGAEEQRVVKGGKGGGFKKKFSAQVGNEAPAPGPVATVAAEAPPAPQKVVVSGKAGLGAESATVVKGGAPNPELEGKVKSLEAALKQKEDALAKVQAELAAAKDPAAKRDVITNIKDTQSEGLKQHLKAMEGELEEAKEREKELMKMVDKAVQMKDDAAKKIKELELKVKQSGGTKGSKEQMLEKQLEEANRKIKELANRIGEMRKAA